MEVNRGGVNSFVKSREILTLQTAKDLDSE